MPPSFCRRISLTMHPSSCRVTSKSSPKAFSRFSEAMKRYGFAEFAHHQNRENQVPSAPPPPPLLSVFFYKIHKAIVQPCANQYCTLGDTANFVTESSSYCRHSICPPADEGHNVYLTFPIAVVPRGDGQFEGFCLLCFLSQIKFLLELTVSLV